MSTDRTHHTPALPGWNASDVDAARLEGWVIDARQLGVDQVRRIVALPGGRLAPYSEDTALCYVTLQAELGSERHRRGLALVTHTERTEEGVQSAKVRLLSEALQAMMRPGQAGQQAAIDRAGEVLSLVERDAG